MENRSRCKRCISRWLERAVRAGGGIDGRKKQSKQGVIQQLLPAIDVRRRERLAGRRNNVSPQLSKTNAAETGRTRLQHLGVRSIDTRRTTGRSAVIRPGGTGPSRTPTSPDWPRRRPVCGGRDGTGAAGTSGCGPRVPGQYRRAGRRPPGWVDGGAGVGILRGGRTAVKCGRGADGHGVEAAGVVLRRRQGLRMALGFHKRPGRVLAGR